MATGDRKDPYRGYNFRLEIDGITKAGFRECSGLDAAEDNTGKQSSPTNPELRPIAGKPKYNNVTLKWGITDDHSLLKWGDLAIDGKTERKNGSIILMDEDRQVKRWNFVNGWPTKWVGPFFDSTANDVAIETLEIAHEELIKA